MEFKEFLSEEEKKIDKLSMTFMCDKDEKEVYAITDSKKNVMSVVGVVAKDMLDRYPVIGAMEAVKLGNKGYAVKLFDLGSLRKHVAKEVEEALKSKSA